MIETVQELTERVRDVKTAGYLVEFDIHANHERHRDWLVITVESSEPNPNLEDALNGEYWFWADGTVMQVL